MIKYWLIILFFVSFTATAMLPVIDTAAVAQLAHQLTQLKLELKYIKQEIQALRPDQYKWTNIEEVINNIGNITQRANGLSYTASNINEQFKETFPGYTFRKNIIDHYKERVNKTQNTLNGILQAVSESAKEFKKEKERLQFFQEQVKSAVGQMQAIQASSQIALEMVSQIELLRQTIIEQINAQTAFYAEQVQHTASAKEELEKFIHEGSTTVPSYASSGNSLIIPDFKI